MRGATEWPFDNDKPPVPLGAASFRACTELHPELMAELSRRIQAHLPAEAVTLAASAAASRPPLGPALTESALLALRKAEPPTIDQAMLLRYQLGGSRTGGGEGRAAAAAGQLRRQSQQGGSTRSLGSKQKPPSSSGVRRKFNDQGETIDEGVPCPELGAGWRRVSKARTGASAGKHMEHFWVSPSGRRFNTRVKALRFKEQDGGAAAGDVTNADAADEVSRDDDEEEDDERVWVGCDRCGKWRKLMPTAMPLPAEWYCEMSDDPLRNTCEAEEESWEEEADWEEGESTQTQPAAPPPPLPSLPPPSSKPRKEKQSSSNTCRALGRKRPRTEADGAENGGVDEKDSIELQRQRILRETADCGICKYCIDKPKKGGANTLRQRCVEKQAALNRLKQRASAEKDVAASQQSQTASSSHLASLASQYASLDDLSSMDAEPAPISVNVLHASSAPPGPTMSELATTEPAALPQYSSTSQSPAVASVSAKLAPAPMAVCLANQAGQPPSASGAAVSSILGNACVWAPTLMLPNRDGQITAVAAAGASAVRLTDPNPTASSVPGVVAAPQPSQTVGLGGTGTASNTPASIYAAPALPCASVGDNALGEARGAYICGRCGQLKKGHVCLGRPPVLNSANTDVGADAMSEQDRRSGQHQNSRSVATGAAEREPKTGVGGSGVVASHVNGFAPKPTTAASRPMPTVRQQAAQLAAAEAVANATAATTVPEPAFASKAATNSGNIRKLTPGNKSSTLTATPTRPRMARRMGEEAWVNDAHTGQPFRTSFGQGQPVVVGGVHLRLKESWLPEELARLHGAMEVSLVEVAHGEQVPFEGHTIAELFAGFAAPERRPVPPRLKHLSDDESLPLLKLRDWPSDAGFRELLPDHFSDLMSALPLGAYTRLDGHMNLASFLPEIAVPPDLGPKCCCAYGEIAAGSAVATASGVDLSGAAHGERNVDDRGPPGTTKLHFDMADAVNVLVHVENADFGAGVVRNMETGEVYGQTLLPSHGAVWHVFSQSDSRLLQGLLPRIVRERGVNDGNQEQLDSTNVLLDGCIYLDDGLLTQLHAQAGIVPYVILQRLGDAVLIPAGCAHQVRNLRSCIKVAADFVAAEHVGHCVRITEELRQLPARHHRRADVLSIRSILLYAACACLASLEEHKRREEARRRDEKQRRALKATSRPADTTALGSVAVAMWPLLATDLVTASVATAEAPDPCPALSSSVGQDGEIS